MGAEHAVKLRDRLAPAIGTDPPLRVWRTRKPRRLEHRLGGTTYTVSSELLEALSRPTAYPHRPNEVEVRETHISWVFLAGEHAYKLKKPVVLDFVDYGTPGRRRKMCEEEVRLNRRLAPDIYLGTRGVTLLEGRAELIEADDPRAVDYLVEMRRYDERRTLAARLERAS